MFAFEKGIVEHRMDTRQRNRISTHLKKFLDKERVAYNPVAEMIDWSKFREEIRDYSEEYGDKYCISSNLIHNDCTKCELYNMCLQSYVLGVK